MNVNRGDLVKTEEGYYGIVLRIAPDDHAVVAISNGLIWGEPPESLERLPLQFDGSIERGDAWANFMGILDYESATGDRRVFDLLGR